MNTWREECIYILEALGGHAYLPDIYDKFLEIHTREVISSYKASIRDTLEKGCRGSAKFDGNEVFYMVEGKNQGHYGIVKPKNETADLTFDDDEFCEGKKNLVEHIRRERNQKLITEAKRRFKANHNGQLYCEACGFNFLEVYGPLGENFIEAHHIKPVSELKENERTKVEDIVMLCSNCHSMIHRKKPWLTRDKLKDLIK